MAVYTARPTVRNTSQLLKSVPLISDFASGSEGSVARKQLIFFRTRKSFNSAVTTVRPLLHTRSSFENYNPREFIMIRLDSLRYGVINVRLIRIKPVGGKGIYDTKPGGGDT